MNHGWTRTNKDCNYSGPSDRGRNRGGRESDEVRPGVIADFGYDGGVVRFAVLDASKVVDRTREMQFALADG